MKKLMFTLLSVCLLVSFIPAASVFASEIAPGDPSNVTITVVLPDKAETVETETVTEPEAAPEVVSTPKIVLYPVDVSENRINGGWQIVKTYELGALDNPADIPRGDFERKGSSGTDWLFTLTDIIKKETANADTKPHIETVTLNTDTKELEKILTQLAPTMEYKTEDEFAGILTLDVASIKVETAGTKTSSYTMSVTREYPRLSSADTSLVPKTVEEKSKTYTLAGVDWKVGNYESVDYEQIPEYYTAIASYTATGTSTKATGYITTAEYKGTLAKLSQGKTVYTAYFEGEEIRTPLEFTEQSSQLSPRETDAESPAAELADEPAEPAESAAETPEPAEAEISETDPESGANTALYAVIAVIAVIAIILVGAAYIIIRRKPRNEKTDNPTADVRFDADGGDPRAGR